MFIKGCVELRIYDREYRLPRDHASRRQSLIEDIAALFHCECGIVEGEWNVIFREADEKYQRMEAEAHKALSNRSGDGKLPVLNLISRDDVAKAFLYHVPQQRTVKLNSESERRTYEAIVGWNRDASLSENIKIVSELHNINPNTLAKKYRKMSANELVSYCEALGKRSNAKRTALFKKDSEMHKMERAGRFRRSGWGKTAARRQIVESGRCGKLSTVKKLTKDMTLDKIVAWALESFDLRLGPTERVTPLTARRDGAYTNVIELKRDAMDYLRWWGHDLSRGSDEAYARLDDKPSPKQRDLIERHFVAEHGGRVLKPSTYRSWLRNDAIFKKLAEAYRWALLAELEQSSAPSDPKARHLRLAAINGVRLAA